MHTSEADMTISFQKQGNYEYGMLCTVTRKGKKVEKIYGKSLGRVIDRERMIFFNREHGLYKYDEEKDLYLPAPSDVELPKRKSRLKSPSRPITFSFGALFLLDEFMKKQGIYALFDEAYADKIATLKAMICFYITSALSNSYAQDWYASSYACKLFPKAALSSTQISELFKYIGDPNRQMIFLTEYLQWFRENYGTDDLGNILIDSTGLPNSVHFSLTAISNHNGEINKEVRLIYVVQQSTGLPIYFRCIPGNIIDINTIKRTIIELEQLGVDTNYVITDAGYLSEENVDLFYLSSISFLIRLQPNRRLYKDLIRDHLQELKTSGILVKQRERLIRVLQVPCCLESKNAHNSGYPVYAYLCVDEQKLALEQLHLIEQVVKEHKSIEDYSSELEKKGIFILISRRNICPYDVIELYYTRQEIEQVFDFGKNYARMLSLSIQQEDTFRGHMVLTFISTVIIKLLVKKLSKTHYPLKPTIENLKNQSCTLFKNCYVTTEPNKITREAFKALEIDYPVTFPVA